MSNDVVEFDKVYNRNRFELMNDLSKQYATATLTPGHLRNKPQDIAMILQMGYELNMMPMQSIMGIDCIQGKPAVKPQAMLGMVKNQMPKAYVKIEESPASVTVTGWRDYDNKKDQFYKTTWNLDRAKLLGLLNKDNWKKQAQTMLKWRAVSDCLRTEFSDVVMGIMSTHEAEDLEPSPVQQAEEMIAAKKDDIEMNEKILKKEKPEEDIGEFVISMGSLEGKKLKEIDVAELIEFYNSAKGHFEDGKVSMNNKEKVLLNVLEMYLTEKNLIEPK